METGFGVFLILQSARLGEHLHEVCEIFFVINSRGADVEHILRGGEPFGFG